MTQRLDNFAPPGSQDKEMSDPVYMPQPKRPDVVEARLPTTEQHCRELYGFPSTWVVSAWHAKGEGLSKYLEIDGGIYPEKYKRGPRKGQTNYSKPLMETKVSLTNTMHDKWLAEWEQATGFCCECSGTGHAWAGWNVHKGSRFRPCLKCGATGKAKLAEAAA